MSFPVQVKGFDVVVAAGRQVIQPDHKPSAEVRALTDPQLPEQHNRDGSQQEGRNHERSGGVNEAGRRPVQAGSRGLACNSLADFTDPGFDLGKAARPLTHQQLNQGMHQRFYDHLADPGLLAGMAGQHQIGIYRARRGRRRHNCRRAQP